jgi:hypothetical protein
MNDSVSYYMADLRAILNSTVDREYVEEAVAEVNSHLYERAEELRLDGVAAPEDQAVAEFGDVREIAMEFAKGCPPKRGFDVRLLCWLPEAALLAALWFAKTSYSIYAGSPYMPNGVAHGIESAAFGSSGFMCMMLIIPGACGALSRLQYPRFRSIAIHTRMANYGLAITLASTACLVMLQITGKTTLTSMYPRMYESAAEAIALYAAMLFLRSNNRLMNSIIRKWQGGEPLRGVGRIIGRFSKRGRG